MALDFGHIRKPARKLRKLLKQISTQPTQEEIHDFRTNSRRLESAVHAMSCDSSTTNKKILKAVSRIRKRAGKVRDMDVLTEYAASLQPDESEKQCEVQLLEYLGAKRSKAAKRFRGVAREDQASLRRRLKRLQRDLLKLESEAQNGAISRKLNASASAIQAGSELADSTPLNHSSLHPFRLKVKNLRNILRLASDPDHDLIDALGEVKDRIGEWHDWQELLVVAQKNLDHGPRCPLVSKLEAITHERYQTAFKQVQHLRTRYLGLTKHSNKSGAYQESPTNPVWPAAMKLAP